jgi:hypothetical protein
MNALVSEGFLDGYWRPPDGGSPELQDRIRKKRSPDNARLRPAVRSIHGGALNAV